MPSFRAQVLLGIAERKTVFYLQMQSITPPPLPMEKLQNFLLFVISSKESKLGVKLGKLLTQGVSSRYKYTLCTYVLHHNGIISIYINSKNMHRKVSIRISNSRRNSIS